MACAPSSAEVLTELELEVLALRGVCAPCSRTAFVPGARYWTAAVLTLLLDASVAPPESVTAASTV